MLRGGAVGDFILTLPVLTALRQRFPQAHLAVLGYPHIAQLAQAGGLIDAVHAVEARQFTTFFAVEAALDPESRDFFASFDVIISYFSDPAGRFVANLNRCFKGLLICGPHRPDDAGAMHAVDVLLKPLEALDLVEADPHPRLELPDAPEHRLPGHPWLALHPGSGSESKTWPEVNWAQLLNELVHRTSTNFLLIGGEAEGPRVERLAQILPALRRRVLRHQPLLDVARWLKGCDAYVGHDSGITHLAAAMRLKGLVLWGPTQESVWRPRSDRLILLHHEFGLQALPVEQVRVRLQTMIG